MKHTLAALGIGFLNGTTLPGYGDAFTPHVQYPGLLAEFSRRVGCRKLGRGRHHPAAGESGEPGLGHYTDQAGAWTTGKLLSLRSPMRRCNAPRWRG